jgi:putative nucleotidyltransferase with HDIG domain
LIARYNNDEYVIIMKDFDEKRARVEAENLKEHLKNVTVLGVGPVDYNFSFVTFPAHGVSVVDLLTLLEQAMLISKSRGKSQVSGFDEVRGKGRSEKRWQELLTFAIPEIVLKKASLKTGPEVIENIKEHLNKQKRFYSADILDSVQSLALALDAKDSYTEGHSKRVSEYAFMLARYLGLDSVEIEWIRLAASMHDIGKIGIPEGILCKPGKLTKEEYEVMKKHPVIGARILKPIKPLEKVTNLVLYHHEYWDGSGYPNGLSKTEIPIGSRIVSIVDAYQAMTSSRPYRTALPQEEAISRLKAGKEKQWDPDLTEAFIKIVT